MKIIMDTTVTTLVAAAQQKGTCDFFNISCDSIALRCDVGVRFSLVLVTDLDLKEIRARAARVRARLPGAFSAL